MHFVNAIKLALPFVGVLSLGIAASIADPLSPFIGHWEDNDYNCTLTSAERNSGSYLVIARTDEPGDLAILIQGDYATEGGGCNLRNAVKTGPKVEVDAMCRMEEFDPSPTKLEFSLVYDEKHLAVMDKRYPTLQFYTLCSRDADSWSSVSEPETPKHTTGTLTPPDIFWWLADSFCDQKTNPDASLAKSSGCQSRIEECKSDSQKIGCPSFQSCEYWRGGKLVSEAACVLSIHSSGTVTKNNWLWQNGNRVTIKIDTTNDGQTWSGQKVVTSNPSQTKSCYSIAASSEKFCATPNEWYFQ